MGTVTQNLEAPAGYSTGSVPVEFYQGGGTTVQPLTWAFTNPGTNLQVTFPFKAINYGSGAISVDIDFYAQTGVTSGSVGWKVYIVSQTSTAAESMEAADNTTVGATCTQTINATAKGPTRASGSVASADADGIANNSICYLKIQRDTSNTTLADVALLKSVTISYSDGNVNPTAVVAGPGSSTNNDVMIWSGTGGTAAADSGVLYTNLAVATGSVTSGNIASFTGTNKNVQDSGVSATAHAARHNVSGADALFTGTWNNSEIPSYTGSAWAPHALTQLILSSDFTVASTSQADVTGLTFAVPRAGTYQLSFSGIFTTGGTTSTAILGANFTGTVTRITIVGVMTTTSAGNFIYIASTSNNGGGTCTTGANLTIASWMRVILTCSTTGTLSVRAGRSNNAVLKAGSGCTIQEM
jgi:hypothetical protein